MRRGLMAGWALVALGAIILLASLFLFINLQSLDMLHPGPVPWRTGIMIGSVNWDNNTGQIRAYVQNFGPSETTLSRICVNGTVDDKAAIVPQVLPPNETAEITLSETYMIMPKQITVEVHTGGGSVVSRRQTFIGFEMLRAYWDEITGRIRVLVRNTGDYPEVNFDKVYVNGTLDDAAVITQSFEDPTFRIYEVSLSGTYVSEPTKMLLRITTVDGTPFELASPFTGVMAVNLVKWDQNTGKISFLVYVPTARFLEGERAIAFDEVYVNGTLDESAVITRVYSETYEVTLSKAYAICPSQVTVKVTTDFGAFEEAYDSDLTDTVPDSP